MSRRARIAFGAAVLAVVAMAIATVSFVTVGHQPPLSQRPGEGKPPSLQAVVPFVGLDGPHGVAVDAAGNVYVTDRDNNRVLKLPAR